MTSPDNPSISSAQNASGNLSVDEPHYSIPTYSSSRRAGWDCSLPTRNIQSTPSSQPSRNPSGRGGRQKQTLNRRPSQSSDKTSGFSSGANTAVELRTSSPGTSLHKGEGDLPNPQTQQEEDISKEHIQETGETNPASGVDKVIENSTSYPGDATAIVTPPPCSRTEPKEEVEKEVVTDADPASETKLPFEIDGKPVQFPTKDGTPSSDQPDPATKSTDGGKNNGPSRYYMNTEKNNRIYHDNRQKPLGKNLKKVKPNVTVRKLIANRKN